MPPLFVDGVEIKSVFVDGEKQQEVFADGVGVFLAADEMFDDYERSANGTILTNHTMNTGQGYLYGAEDSGSTIQTYQNQQTASYNQLVQTVDAIVHLLPQPVEQASAFEAVLEFGSFFPNAWRRQIRITCTESSPTNRVVGVFESTATVEANISGRIFIQIGDDADTFGEVNFNGIVDDRGFLTCWYDGEFAQVKLVLNSGTFFSEKVAIPPQPRLDEIFMLEFNVLNVARALIKSYTLTPYNPIDVPFP